MTFGTVTLMLSHETGLYLDLGEAVTRKLTRPNKETMIQLVSTMKNSEIAELYGVTATAVSNWRRHYGLSSSPAEAASRWNTDRNFFSSINTPNKAYILGFILADGHVDPKGRVDISVKETDGPLLRRMSDIIGCNAPLKTAKNSYDGSPRARAMWCGKQITEDLNNLGLSHDKSTTAVFPKVSRNLESHLARGLWDGDGYIGKNQFEIIGTSDVLDGLTEAIKRHTGCSLRRRMGGKNKAYHYAYGTRRDSGALEWMYGGADLVLERKMKSFLDHWSKNPRA